MEIVAQLILATLIQINATIPSCKLIAAETSNAKLERKHVVTVVDSYWRLQIAVLVRLRVDSCLIL